MRRPFSALLASLLGTLACTTHTQVATCTPDPSAPPIVIGVSLQLSGAFQTDGTATQQGYDLWVDQVNADGGLNCRPVQLDVLDNGSSVGQTSADYTTLIAGHHDDLVVGPFADDYAVAAATSAAALGYPLLCGSCRSPSVFTQGLTNLFSTSLPASDLWQTFTQYVLALPDRPTTAAYATEDEPYLRPIVEDILAAFTAGGVPPAIAEIVYPASTTNWTSYANELIQAQADVLVLGTTTPDAIAFVNQIQDAGYNPKVLLEVSGPNQGTVFTTGIGGANVAEGLLVPGSEWYPGIKTADEPGFEAAFAAKYGGTAADISQDAVQGYVTLQVLQQAVEAIGSFDNGLLMQELRTDTFQTIGGPVKFAADGEDQLALSILFQWQGAALIPVFPPQTAIQAAEFPKPDWP